MQRRWKLSSAQRADMWNRWKAGQSLHAIGRALGKDKQVIHFLLARHGGIAPAVRRRSARVLTLAEREDYLARHCQRLLAAGHRPSCGSYFLHSEPGSGPPRRACAISGQRADQQAWESARRPKPCRLATHRRLQQLVASKLMQDWSPQQISG